MKTLLIIALAFMCSIAAQAAPKPTPMIEQGSRVRGLAKTLDVQIPTDWHFLLVDEIEWRNITRQSGLLGGSKSAVSNLRDHFTYIRLGYALAATDYELRGTIAHEMGHYLCGCTNEDKANKIEAQIIAESH